MCVETPPTPTNLQQHILRAQLSSRVFAARVQSYCFEAQLNTGTWRVTQESTTSAPRVKSGESESEMHALPSLDLASKADADDDMADLLSVGRFFCQNSSSEPAQCGPNSH